MTDEVPQVENPTPEPQQTETPEVQQEETPANDSPAINLDSKISVDGEDVSVNDLLKAKQDNEFLLEYQKHASKLMRSEGVPAEEREQSVRWVMTAEGYTPEQINEYVGYMKNMGQEQQPAPEQPQAEPQQQQPENQHDDTRAREMEERMAQQEHALRQQQVAQMRRNLDSSVEQTMGSSTDIQSLVDAAKRLGGDDNASSSRAALRADLERETVSELKRMRASGVNVDDRSFAEAANKAAEVVANRYRAVIGDPNLVRRAPETDSGQDTFVSNKPIETPEFQKGKDTFITAQDKVRKFTEDSLNKLASEVDSGGKSRI
jgi:hypothetical protein